jgi:hypothetical protein
MLGNSVKHFTFSKEITLGDLATIVVLLFGWRGWNSGRRKMKTQSQG